MTNKELSEYDRHALTEYCIYIRAILEDVKVEEIAKYERCVFEGMSDGELSEEADFLGELLYK